jgi:hypothetical protein
VADNQVDIAVAVWSICIDADYKTSEGEPNTSRRAGVIYDTAQIGSNQLPRVETRSEIVRFQVGGSFHLDPGVFRFYKSERSSEPIGGEGWDVHVSVVVVAKRDHVRETRHAGMRSVINAPCWFQAEDGVIIVYLSALFFTCAFARFTIYDLAQSHSCP